MAHVKYWFSAKQKRMRDALSGDITYVFVKGQWVEYTQTTEGDTCPSVWPDFQLVAAGENFQCRVLKNIDCEGRNLVESSSPLVAR